MTDPALTELLDLALEAARRAGALLRDGRLADLGVAATKSSPIDVVTEMDIAAEKLITGYLSDFRPDDGFLGEEGASSPGSTGIRWVTVPLDGTVNYLYGLPTWAVTIAAERDGEPVVGAVRSPDAPGDARQPGSGAPYPLAAPAPPRTTARTTGFNYGAMFAAPGGRSQLPLSDTSAQLLAARGAAALAHTSCRSRCCPPATDQLRQQRLSRPPPRTPPGADEAPPPAAQAAAGRPASSASTGPCDTLLNRSLLALVGLSIIAFAFGYAMAGRVLSPLGRITRTARRVAGTDLTRRIELDGPDDELKELADTFDDMLDRLERAFTAQQRFVGNASHELRTPLAINRTLLEVHLSDPEAPPELQQLGKTLLATNERSEQLVEGLLLLARSDNQIIERKPVDLAEVADRAIDQARSEAVAKNVEIRGERAAAVVQGNGVLLERIALNLVQNAVRYNVAGGRLGGGHHLPARPARPCWSSRTQVLWSRRTRSTTSSSPSGGCVRSARAVTRGSDSACRSRGPSRGPTEAVSSRSPAKAAVS
ncbi:3'(2'),5'-bisphosphate nucleotidase CysQ [Streptomyces microflavus]